MSTYPALVKLIQRRGTHQESFGNDVAFFRKSLNDLRLQVAFHLGWMLHQTIYDGKIYYTLVAPGHYECRINSWTSIYTTKSIDGVEISFPEYYYDDNVLMTGTH